MSFLNSIKDFFMPPEVEESENISQETSIPEPEPVPSAAINPEPPLREEKRNKVVSMQHMNTQLEVVLVKPEAFTDSKQIADHLIAKKTVVLNLEKTSADTRRRIIDFLAGVAYANGGSLKPVANLTYIITPYNVGFVGSENAEDSESNVSLI